MNFFSYTIIIIIIIISVLYQAKPLYFAVVLFLINTMITGQLLVSPTETFPVTWSVYTEPFMVWCVNPGILNPF